MWKKSKGTTKCEKKTITCDVGTTKYEDRTIKCEKKVRKLPNVRKELSYMMLKLYNIRIEPLSVRKKKETTQCDKRTVICDVGTT